MKLILRLSLTTAALVMLAVPAFAQSSLRGKVTDTEGGGNSWGYGACEGIYPGHHHGP